MELTVLLVVASVASGPADGEPALDYRIERIAASKGFDGKTCWVHPRAGLLPARPGKPPTVVLTMQKLLLTGSDVFYALNEMRTADRGATWAGPFEHATLGRRNEPDGPEAVGRGPGVEVGICDFTPKWHRATGKLLGTGHSVRYRDNRVMAVRRREVAYSVYDEDRRAWSAWTTMSLPPRPDFENAGAGSTQRVDLANGEILLPIYFKQPARTQYATTVVRCRFDGRELIYLGHGSELSIPVDRGLYEPSLTSHGGRFYLTMRNDQHGYVSRGTDGLTFEPPRRWTFDDGADLGNYNTQQHWVTHQDGLFLVYTRRGANNDHVFRHRAPLFIAQVDPDRLCVLRRTERILVPERGARLGNFGVVDVDSQETWVTVAEWMQPLGVERYGSDNSVYAARIIWNRPNRLE